jgi:hypothetical protein
MISLSARLPQAPDEYNRYKSLHNGGVIDAGHDLTPWAALS